MELTLTLDIGSDHLCDLGRLKAHIDRAAGLPVMLKAQLFPMEMTGPNVWLPLDLYRQAWEYAESKGVRLYASVFSADLAYDLSKIDRRLSKLASPMRHLIDEPWYHADQIAPVRALFDKWIVSYPLTEARHGEAKNVTQLLCISEYPTWYRPAIEAVDWTAWDGWSSHTFGFEVELDLLRHVDQAGAHKDFYIEKHVRLDRRDTCPDATYAVSWDEVRDFIKDSTSK